METKTKRFRKRDAILNCVCSTTEHPSAEWVYEHVKEEIPDISLATVYRNLSFFKEQGKIISLGTVNGVERFDGNTTPHVHFVCTGCDAISDLPQIAVPEALNQQVMQETGGIIDTCQLTFVGICQTCKEKKQETA